MLATIAEARAVRISIRNILIVAGLAALLIGLLVAGREWVMAPERPRAKPSQRRSMKAPPSSLEDVSQGVPNLLIDRQATAILVHIANRWGEEMVLSSKLHRIDVFADGHLLSTVEIDEFGRGPELRLSPGETTDPVEVAVPSDASGRAECIYSRGGMVARAAWQFKAASVSSPE
jgi:hypothetical protein